VSQPTAPPAVVDPLSRSISGVGLVVAAVCSVQVGAALAKNLFPTLGVAGVVWLRLGIAAIVLVVAWRPRAWRWDRHTLLLVAAFGLIVAAMNSTFYASLDRIPLGIAVTVEFVGPLALAALLSRRLVDGLWVLLAAAGILLLLRAEGAGPLDWVGVVLAAVAGVFWAGYILLSARVGDRVAGGAGLAVALVVSALVTAPAGLASVAGHLSWHAVAVAAGVALLSSALPWSLEMEALRRVPTGVFGILMSLEPAVAAVSGWALLHETLLPRQWGGVVAVVLASAGAAVTRSRTRRPQPLAMAGQQP
jgi:inner membrane transporter RhtA